MFLLSFAIAAVTITTLLIAIDKNNNKLPVNYTMDYQIYINLSDEEKQKCSIKQDESSMVYNVNTNLITSDLSGVFKEGVEYKNVISKCLANEYSLDKEKIEELINNHEYTISSYMIIFKSGDAEYNVYYGDFNVGDFK